MSSAFLPCLSALNGLPALVGRLRNTLHSILAVILFVIVVSSFFLSN